MISLMTRLNNMKIRNKLIMAFLLVVIVPTLIVGIFLTYRFRQTAIQNALMENDKSVSRIKKLTQDFLKIPENISSALLFDKKLEEVVNTRYDTVLSAFKAYREYTDIKEYLQIYSRQVANIRLYIDNPTLVANWYYIRPDEDIKKTYWYSEATRMKAATNWYFIEDETQKNRKFLSLVRKIRFDSYNTSGVLVISVDGAYLSSMLSQEPFIAYITDANNNIVATNRQEYIGLNLKDAEFPADLIQQGAGTYDRVVGGEPLKIVVDILKPDSSQNSLKIISVFSIDNILKESNMILLQGLIIIVTGFIVAGILITVFSNLLSKRFTKLSAQIKQVEKGDLDAISDITGSDEIGQLSEQFNRMMASIKRLIYEVTESNRQKSQLMLQQNELRLKMMASQINPHFLFNSLESIRLKALINGENETSQVIKALGRLMRKKLEIHGEDILLGTEIEMVRCYLEIEKYRYGKRLEFEILVEPEAENVMVPALAIQPLVENAVHHGMKSVDEPCIVKVEAKICDGMLHVSVSDNGEGMSEDKLKSIIKEMNETERHKGDRIGLHNVHMRLKLTYGEEHGLRIESRLHEGTKVAFSLPAGGVSNVPCYDCG